MTTFAITKSFGDAMTESRPISQSTTIHDCLVRDLPKIGERKGYITPIYGRDQIPFDIARVYYLYDIPGGASRAAHAHRGLQQLLVSVLGSFDVVLDDGRERKTITLNRPYGGLYLPPGIWRDLNNFSSGAICLVLASDPYSEADYIRDYAQFLVFKKVTP